MNSVRERIPSARQGMEEAIRYNRERTIRDYSPESYRVNRYDAAAYFDHRRKWKQKVHEYFAALHRDGERVVYVDVCGSASGKNLGADISYCFALKTPEFAHWFHPAQDFLVEGDLFRMKDFNTFLRLLRQRGDRPALVTFEPIVGLQGYTPFEGKSNSEFHSRVTYQRLENNLRRMIQLLRPGGYIYLDRPFQLTYFVAKISRCFSQQISDEDSELAVWIRGFCKRTRCSVEMQSSITGPKFLIRKWKNPRKENS